MSEAKIVNHGPHSEIELLISKVGKLGIEFRSTTSPYFVINVSPEAQALYGVQPGDLLLAVGKDSTGSWTNVEGLEWAGLIDVLKHRPARAIFKRFNIGSQRPPSGSQSPMVSKSPNAERIPPHASPISAVRDASPTVQPGSPIAQLHKDSSPKANVSEAVKNPIKSPFVHSAASPKPQVPQKPESLPSLSPKSVPVPEKVSTPVRAVTPERRPSIQQEQGMATVVYSSEGPLGLEFEDMDYPYRVGAVRAQSMSAEKGVRKGDCLTTVNGKNTKGMSWDEIRAELATRPAIVVFQRDASAASQAAQSVWNLAAGLVRGSSTPENDPIEDLRRERDELRMIVSSVGAEDLGTLRQVAKDHESLLGQMASFEEQLRKLQEEKEAAASIADEERAKSLKLVDVIDEIEKSQSAVIERFEKEIQERERVIADLKLRADRELSAAESDVSPVEALKQSVAQLEAKLELIEKDNSRLRKENTDLGVMVQQCLEKIQRDLSDKPHWVDRRVVCSAVATLLRETEAINPASDTAIDAHLTARQKLGDVLGLTYDERASVGLLTFGGGSSSPKSLSRGKATAVGEDFVSFLERETMN